jgi:hypothetical protein
MAATLPEVMDAIESALDAIPALRVRDVVGPDLPVTGSASAAVVFTPDIPAYRSTMGRGSYHLDVEIGVFTATGVVDRIGQRKLAAFASQTGTSSIRAALESDPTLGGVASTSYLTSFRRLGVEEVGVIGYFGGLFAVFVQLPGV